MVGTSVPVARGWDENHHREVPIVAEVFRSFAKLSAARLTISCHGQADQEAAARAEATPLADRRSLPRARRDVLAADRNRSNK